MKQDKTHFGYQSVAWEKKTSLVRGVFDSVATSYDRMNDVMSLGVHRLWKREFVSSLSLRTGANILDLAGGTGDIAFAMKRAANADVTVCDINAAMLHEGRNRAFDNQIHGLKWVCGNGECLPFPDRSFDMCTIAFGIRNVTHIPAALSDIYRVLKPGGHFACLEFSSVRNPLLKPMYDTYSFKLIPQFGEWIARDRESYQYLVESIRQFPDQNTFAEMIKDAGFDMVSHRNLSGGIVAIHSGWRI